MTKRLIGILCVCLFLTTGCNLMYKMNIQQGNALEQEDLDQLELGMSKNQVAFLMGTPAIQDPFHHNRWDYVSTFARRGGDPVRRVVTLEFENDALTSMTGVGAGEGEVILSAGGPEAVTSPVPGVGVDVTQAKDYQDLEILRDGSPTWTLQLGSFSDRQEADAFLAEVEAQGIEATIYGQVIENTGFFVVRSGSYASRDDAARVQNDLESRLGRRSFLVPPGT
jgi:outer membrane protein assembly factor BamE